MHIWLENTYLGMIIARQRLRGRIFGHPSQRRIERYRRELDSCFDYLQKCTFINETPTCAEHTVEIVTSEDDDLYAPCVKQLLWDHFKVGTRIVKQGQQRKLTVSKGKGVDIDLDSVKSYITANLYHHFNLYTGSSPTQVCRFIRELEAILKDVGSFEPQKDARIYWTVDAEAQTAYVDNRRMAGTNIFSARNKSSLLLSETMRNISASLDLPHTYFIPMELIDHNGKDRLGNAFCNIDENRKAVRGLPSHASIAFHGCHHDEYRKLWAKGNLTQEYVESEIRKGMALAEEAGIEMLPINRYPSLSREPFSLDIIEKHGFKTDTSDLVDDATLPDFSGYCRYRLLKFEGTTIKPSEVWEIPVIYADPYVIYFNIKKIKNLVACLEKGKHFHNSEIALMFHDKVIGFPESGEMMYNLDDGRATRSAQRDAINYLQHLILKESSLQVSPMAQNTRV